MAGSARWPEPDEALVHCMDLDEYHRLRPEQKFDGPEALIAQIRRDVEETRAWFA